MRSWTTAPLLSALLAAAGCGGAPSGLVTMDVAADGTVSIYMVDEAGGLIAPSDVYLQVRGVRTQIQYAGAAASDTICTQLPASGPLEVRITSAFEDCPEVHAAAYYFDPPSMKRADGTSYPPPDVAVTQRCTTYAGLLHTTVWLPAGCEDVRGEGTSP
jgi:hypothetical protein